MAIGVAQSTACLLRMSRKKNKGATQNVPARREATDVAPAGGNVFPRQGEMFPEAIVASRTTFQGPLPPPGTLSEYEQALPGLAERIVTMAEVEGNHRRRTEGRLVRLSEGGLFSATLITLVIVVGSIFLIWHDKTIGGLAALVTAVAGLVAVFILGGRSGPPADTTANDEQ